MNKILYFIIFFLIIPVFSIAEDNLMSVPEWECNIHLSKPEAMSHLQKILQKEGIQFKLRYHEYDKRQYIVWHKKDDPRVRKIIYEITKSDCGEPGKENITLINNEQNEYLVDLMEEQGIPYRVIESKVPDRPGIAVEYRIEDELKVEKLIKKVLKEKSSFKGS